MDTFEASHGRMPDAGGTRPPSAAAASPDRLAPLRALVVMVASSAALWLVLIGGAYLVF